ncbi:MAG: YWFCY domain-containing protein, partial [Chryseobacterium taeanense]
MQEQQHQIKIYGFLQKVVYAVVALDCASLFYLNANIPVVSNLLKNFSKMSFIYPPLNAKFATLVLIGLVAVGTKAKKKKDLNIAWEIIIPMAAGLFMIFSSLIWQEEAGNTELPKVFPGMNLYQVIYACLSFLGATVLHRLLPRLWP